MKKQLAIVIGTRPEAIKLIPVYFAFKKSHEFDPFIVSTGQHREMLEEVFKFFGVKPEIELNVMTRDQSLGSLTALLCSKLEEFVANTAVSGIVVQGDTTTAFVAGLIGFYRQIKVIHVEAGLRTNDRYSPFPEEMNRKMLSSLANIHFCPTERSVKALALENITENVFNVGNTVIDALLMTIERISEDTGRYESFFSELIDLSKTSILVTSHRREHFGEGLRNICDSILEIADSFPEFEIIYPVHLNPTIQKTVKEHLSGKNNIRLLDPLPYDYMVYLMNRAFIILTDSGGIQEEAPSLGKPILVLRETTERPEGIEAGCALLAGTSAKGIVSAFEAATNEPELYARMTSAANPYGDGKSSDRIVRECERLFDRQVGAAV